MFICTTACMHKTAYQNCIPFRYHIEPIKSRIESARRAPCITCIRLSQMLAMVRRGRTAQLSEWLYRCNLRPVYAPHAEPLAPTVWQCQGGQASEITCFALLQVQWHSCQAFNRFHVTLLMHDYIYTFRRNLKIDAAYDHSAYLIFTSQAQENR